MRFRSLQYCDSCLEMLDVMRNTVEDIQVHHASGAVIDVTLTGKLGSPVISEAILPDNFRIAQAKARPRGRLRIKIRRDQ